jgi:hypothetical protein
VARIQPAQVAVRTTPKPGPAADDDFQIERF